MSWRQTLETWVGAAGVPEHRGLGARYPHRVVALHALTRAHRSKVLEARRYIDMALSMGLEWRVGLSGGKDSTALALLLAMHGTPLRGMSVKDDLDYPGERAYLSRLGQRIGIELDVIEPPSLRAFLVEQKISLVNDLHSRTAELSATHFYGLLDAYRARSGHTGVFLGLRAEESRGRRLNVATKGPVYTRAYDGLVVAQPLMNWSALDVHAFLAARDVPLLPMYYCVDPDMDPFKMRKSWWVAGGSMANHGHYVWLRRWWPALWELAVDIDPDVATIS